MFVHWKKESQQIHNTVYYQSNSSFNWTHQWWVILTNRIDEKKRMSMNDYEKAEGGFFYHPEKHVFEEVDWVFFYSVWMIWNADYLFDKIYSLCVNIF